MERQVLSFLRTFAFAAFVLGLAFSLVACRPENGINGYRVTGPNGNSIFLPATGYCYGDNVNYRGMYGYFWSSTLCEYNNSLAYSFGFYDGHYGWYVNSRYCGRCVRPVIE